MKDFEQPSNDEALAFFYCDRNQPEHGEPAPILRSFVRQLSTLQNHDAIPSSIVQMYREGNKRALQRLYLDESQTILADLFKLYPQITLVVDALDECDRKLRIGFMKILDKLIAASSKPPVKILISSRWGRDIKRHFENGPKIEIRVIDTRDDIAMFVKHEVFARPGIWQSEMSSELKELIYNTLVDRSGGM